MPQINSPTEDQKATLYDEVKVLIDVSLLTQRADAFEKLHEENQRKQEENWKEVFDKLNKIANTQSEFPLKMEQCKSQIEDDMKDEYLTKTEMRVMLRSAVVAGTFMVAVLNAAFAYITYYNVTKEESKLITSKISKFEEMERVAHPNFFIGK